MRFLRHIVGAYPRQTLITLLALVPLLALVFCARHGRLWSFLQAKGSALRSLPATLRKRRGIQARRVISAKQLDRLLTRRWLSQRWAERGPARRRKTPSRLGRGRL